MPNPNAITVPNYGFNDCEIAVLDTMMNHEDTDYSTVDEVSRLDALAEFSFDTISDAMRNLNRRGFLLEVKKPYGYVYAVNKLRIANMMFDYS